MILLSIQHRDDYELAMRQSSQDLRDRDLNRVLRIANETEFQRKIHGCLVACLAVVALCISSILLTKVLVLSLSLPIIVGSGFLYYRWKQPEYFQVKLPENFVVKELNS